MKAKMINAILRDYRKETQNSWENAGIEWNYLELDAEVSKFCEQLCFIYTYEQIKELYDLL